MATGMQPNLLLCWFWLLGFLNMVDSSLLTSGVRTCTLVFLSFSAALLLNIFVRFVRWVLSPLHKIPGPKQSFLFGAFLDIQKQPFLEPHKKWCNEFGYDKPFLSYSTMFGTQSLLVLDKEVVRTVLTARPGSGRKPRFHIETRNFISARIGDGMLTLEGDIHKRHRRILQPSFQTNFLKERLDEVVPPRVNLLVGAWKQANQGRERNNLREIDAASHLSAVTLDVVGEVLFSHHFQGLEIIQDWAATLHVNDSNDSDDKLAELNDPFLRSMMDAFKRNGFTLMSLLLNAFRVDFLDRYINPGARRVRRTLDDAADLLIANVMETTSRQSMHAKSLLHLMLVAEDPKQQTSGDDKSKERRLNRQELRDETKTFLLAGHETTSTWIYWACYALAKHPDIQDRLYSDIVNHAGSNTDGPILLEQTERMDYLQAFMQEVLRLYPPAGIIFRRNTDNEEIAGYTVPSGTRFAIPVHILHRHPHYWDEPETFSPERWLNVTEDERERRRFAFLPFSGGIRNCIGQRFATYEAQLILAPLVRAFQIRIAPSQRDVQHTFSSFITMKAKPALKIVCQERNLTQ